jgi:hypothetical protein
MDHFGLLCMLPDSIPIYMGQATYELLKFSDRFTPNSIGSLNHNLVKDRASIQIGDSQVMPYRAAVNH